MSLGQRSALGIRTGWPIMAATAAYCVVLATTTAKLLHETDGHFSYALDDSYIHMAIARNLALHGVWGVHAGSFSAASSSPLWTAILGALFGLIGVREWLPLLLNAAAAIGTIALVGARLRRNHASSAVQASILIALVLLTPMVVLTWVGMEHTPAVLLTLAVAWTAADIAVESTPKRVMTLGVFSMLLVGTRYEGLFVVAGCAVALGLAGRVGPMIATTASGLVPPLVVGFWYLSEGWYFLPASIMMKQTVLLPGDASLFSGLSRNVVNGGVPPAFIALSLAASAMVVWDVRQLGVRRAAPLPVVLVVAACLHLLLAKFGFLYRYESYLVALGVFVVGTESARRVADVSPGLDAVTVYTVLVMSLVTFGERAILSHGEVAVTAGHIYRQQRQLARFIGRYYNTDIVALNDIGAVSFFATSRIDDLMGLSSRQAADGRREGRLDARSINEWLDRDRVRVAVIYDATFPSPQNFQDQWLRVAQWNTDEPSADQGRVTFYARDRPAALTLASQLTEFSSSLPPGSTQRVFVSPR